MPVGPIMMGIGTVPSGIASQGNGSLDFFGFTKLFEPLTNFYQNFHKDSNQSYNIQPYTYNGTTRLSIRGHEPVPFAWYLSVFTALIMFLLIISIAEVFCKKPVIVEEVYFPKEENPPPPPPYDLFAPPSYDSVTDNNRKRKMIEVFVISIDSGNMNGSGSNISSDKNTTEEKC